MIMMIDYRTTRRVVFFGLGLAFLAGGCASNGPALQNQAGPPPPPPLVQSNAFLTTGLRPPSHVGVVDLQRVLLDTEAGKRARDVLSNFMKNRQAVIELEEKELKRMEDDLVKQSS